MRRDRVVEWHTLAESSMPNDHPKRPPPAGTITSYSRRQGEYAYDIVISQVPPPRLPGICVRES